MTTATYHEVKTASPVLACDLCGCLIDPSERGRTAHQNSHEQTSEVIDLTGRVALELDRLAS